MNPETDLEILIAKLNLPTALDLQPWLAKLIDSPDSLVIIGIEKPFHPTGPLIGTAWLSSTERVKVRKALLAINKSRSLKGEHLTNEIPNLD